MIRELDRHARAPEVVRTPMLILLCSECGRSVKVFGRVSRVLCACGRVLLEVPSLPSPGQPSKRGESESQ